MVVVGLELLMILQRSRLSEKLSGPRPIPSSFRNTDPYVSIHFSIETLQIVIPVYDHDHDHDSLDLL